MDPVQKQLVKATWKRVAPIAETAAGQFYRHLFEIDPGIRSLFGSTDLAQQRRKLAHVLAMAVAGLDRLDDMAAMVEDLGRRHARYGVEDAHYESVGAALLRTLEQVLGTDWNSEVAAAWAAFYGLLSSAMRRVMRESSAAGAQATA